MRRIALLSAAAVPLLLHGHAKAASFDCTRANSAVERMICAAPALSRADAQLAKLYAAAKQAVDPAGEDSDAVLVDLAAAQRAWLARRDGCATKACLTAAYAEQSAVLGFHGRPGRHAPADMWAGQYDGPGQAMRLTIQVRDDDTVRLGITGADPVAGRWTCNYSSLARIDETTAHTQPTGLVLALSGAAITVAPDGASKVATDSCGLSGSLAGRYMRNGSRPPRR